MIPSRSKWPLYHLVWLELHRNRFNLADAIDYTGKKAAAIYRMKAKMGYGGAPNWTKEEELLLLTHGAKKASLLLNKSIQACRTKHTRLLKK